MTLTKKGEDKEEHQPEAVGIYPNLIEAWQNKGVVLNYLGRIAEALVALEKVIEINPKDEEAWTSIGLDLNDLDRFEEALVAFDKAIEINPKHEFAGFIKGKALLNKGKYEWTRKILR